MNHDEVCVQGSVRNETLTLIFWILGCTVLSLFGFCSHHGNVTSLENKKRGTFFISFRLATQLQPEQTGKSLIS
jgi:hypothetical protein